MLGIAFSFKMHSFFSSAPDPEFLKFGLRSHFLLIVRCGSHKILSHFDALSAVQPQTPLAGVASTRPRPPSLALPPRIFSARQSVFHWFSKVPPTTEKFWFDALGGSV